MHDTIRNIRINTVVLMVKAGLTKEQYENPEYLADFFISLWKNSGKGRKAGIVVCVSLDSRNDLEEIERLLDEGYTPEHLIWRSEAAGSCC